MKTYHEILYLLGDSAEKRRIMRTAGVGVARALNDEVSSVCRVHGKDYYIIGKHPFADFSVYAYMRYERALVDGEPLTKKKARGLLKKLGAKTRLNRKLGSLPFVTRRLVTLAARLTSETTALTINLDGVPYTRYLAKSLWRAVKRLSKNYALWISVTDSRLVEKKGRAVEIRSGAIFSRLRKYHSDIVKRRTLFGKIAACRAEVPPLERGKVVCVR